MLSSHQTVSACCQHIYYIMYSKFTFIKLYTCRGLINFESSRCILESRQLNIEVYHNSWQHLLGVSPGHFWSLEPWENHWFHVAFWEKQYRFKTENYPAGNKLTHKPDFFTFKFIYAFKRKWNGSKWPRIRYLVYLLLKLII